MLGRFDLHFLGFWFFGSYKLEASGGWVQHVDRMVSGKSSAKLVLSRIDTDPTPPRSTATPAIPKLNRLSLAINVRSVL